ncbi:MAG: VOC family protein [Elusimicrobia bacterium]|nr:VOC family protein [Elusimicrobiota bacterium]
MAVKHIAFTVYPVKDMARARKFYEDALGLKLGGDYAGGQWIEYYLDNGCFALTTMFEGSGSGISFEVDDVDKTFKELTAKGAESKMEPFATPVCRNAILHDPDGNVVGLHQKNAGR